MNKNTTHAPVNEHAPYAWYLAVWRRKAVSVQGVSRRGASKVYWPVAPDGAFVPTRNR